MNFIYSLSLCYITKEVNQTISVLKSKNKFCPACYGVSMGLTVSRKTGHETFSHLALKLENFKRLPKTCNLREPG